MNDSPRFNIQTNDDLCQAVNQLTGNHLHSPERSLETYLRALLGICLHHWSEHILTPDAFVGILDEAFTAHPVDYDPHWEQQYSTDWLSLKGWDRFHALICRQIVDLRQMKENGTLTDDYQDPGLQSPQGGHWSNFDIRSFLAQACAGNFDGWTPDEDILFNPPESPIHRDATLEEISEETSVLPPLTWEQFADFLNCGQIHE
jgi:hypothetical protein